MTIKKFSGKTKEEAIAKAKAEFGEGAVVMNVKEVKPSGFFQFFKGVTYEVTAAIEEKDKYVGINLSADEKITLPPISQQTAKMSSVKLQIAEPVAASTVSSEDIEKRLESISNMIEKKFQAQEDKEKESTEKMVQNSENFKFMKILYRTLLDNEVDEKYVNQILEEAEKIANSNNSVDVVLSNVYQKMILKFGERNCIDTEGK